MTQPELNEKQLAELAEMLELAKITEQKARELNELAICLRHATRSHLRQSGNVAGKIDLQRNRKLQQKEVKSEVKWVSCDVRKRYAYGRLRQRT